jgi:hypothetical protein
VLFPARRLSGQVFAVRQLCVIYLATATSLTRSKFNAPEAGAGSGAWLKTVLRASFASRSEQR